MGYTFEERLNALRSRKEEQTKEKIRRNGYMDEDDYGCVPPPEDFVFHPECNDKEHGTFYGAELWGRNFRRLMEAHPVYVDANDALAGRWMFILQRMRPFERTARLPRRPRRSPLSSPDTAIPRRSSWNSMTPSLTARMPLRM